MPELGALRAELARLESVVLGFSGGVDSALLAVVGTEVLGPGRFLAVMGLSPSYPEVQRFAARDLAGRFRIPLLELETRELDDPRYAANPTNRCYFCKAELWRRLGSVAADRGFRSVVDGTNRDDLGEHRPGLRAAAEHGIRSPLADLGWTKADVRAAARQLGIPNWDHPASPCLSSRIQYGLGVTEPRLRQVESGEAFLRSLGVTGSLRVRHLGDRARLEVEPGEFDLLDTRWDDVQRFFGELGFAAVERDVQGYRRGSLLTLAPSA
jgi:uncharacterized protein